ncbi:hypothetical protein FKR84_10305 [Haloflavibacter putidus]|uniref:PhnB protein n=1 Tax=Haloflavibacter putidus TaxID=2576776 RepID=A0A507ZKB4_9FLAO|nr:hypothetical protein FKR84_10305 [Haloflavibacter putidus]
MSVNTIGQDEATRVFNALAENGKITVQLFKTFSESYLGMLTDKSGVNWRINYNLP